MELFITGKQSKHLSFIPPPNQLGSAAVISKKTNEVAECIFEQKIRRNLTLTTVERVLLEDNRPLTKDDLPDSQRRKTFREAVPTLTSALEKRGISCWIDRDTLFGAYAYGDISPYVDELARDQRNIPGETKFGQSWERGTAGGANISLMFEDYTNTLQALTDFATANSAYKVENWTSDTAKPYLRVKYTNAEGFSDHIELRFHQKNDEGKIIFLSPYGHSQDKAWEYPVPEDMIFPLGKTQIGGKEVPAPAKTQAYLLRRRGSLAPRYHWSKTSNRVEPIIGEYCIAQQKKVLKGLKKFVSNEKADFSNAKSTEANLVPGPVEPDKEAAHKQWKEAIFELNRLCEMIGVPLMPDAGTMLGTVRYGQILGHDHDADVGTFLPFYDTLLDVFTSDDEMLQEVYGIEKRSDFPILNKSEYSVENWSQWTYIDDKSFNNKNYLRLRIPGGDYIDIYFHHCDPATKQVHWIDPYPIDQTYPGYHVLSEEKTIFPLVKAKFYTGELHVPRDAVTYLRERYGKDISPIFEWNDTTKKYDKPVAGHPYWEQQVHKSAS